MARGRSANGISTASPGVIGPASDNVCTPGSKWTHETPPSSRNTAKPRPSASSTCVARQPAADPGRGTATGRLSVDLQTHGHRVLAHVYTGFHDLRATRRTRWRFKQASFQLFQYLGRRHFGERRFAGGDE